MCLTKTYFHSEVTCLKSDYIRFRKRANFCERVAPRAVETHVLTPRASRVASKRESDIRSHFFYDGQSNKIYQNLVIAIVCQNYYGF